MSRRGIIAMLLVSWAISISGCGGRAGLGAEPATSQSASPAAPTHTPASPTVEPTPQPTPDNGIPEGDIPAGTYTATGFEPNIRFVLGEGWSHTLGFEANVDEALLLLWKPEPGDEAIYFDATAPAVEPAQALVGIFGRLRGVTLGDPQPVLVGGAPGLAVDGTVDAELDTPVVEVFGLAEHYEFRPGDRFRAIVLDVDGQPLLVIVESNGDEFEVFLAKATEVLDSVSFP